MKWLKNAAVAATLTAATLAASTSITEASWLSDRTGIHVSVSVPSVNSVLHGAAPVQVKGDGFSVGAPSLAHPFGDVHVDGNGFIAQVINGTFAVANVALVPWNWPGAVSSLVSGLWNHVMDGVNGFIQDAIALAMKYAWIALGALAAFVVGIVVIVLALRAVAIAIVRAVRNHRKPKQRSASPRRSTGRRLAKARRAPTPKRRRAAPGRRAA